MAERWQPVEGVPGTEVPNMARVYDALLGGSHNYAADRQLADRLTAAEPDAPYWARTNRAYLRRAVRYLVQQGVRQFLDIGAGLPTVGNVHEVAAQHTPDARVVYVDIDPVAVEFGNRLLADADRVAAVQADLRDPEAILTHPQVRALIDFDQPVGVLLVAVLHFIADTDHPAVIVRRLREAVVAGSYLVISHATTPANMTAEQVHAAKDYGQAVTPVTLRTYEQILHMFDGWRLVDPGLAVPAWWRPDDGDEPQTPAEVLRAARVPGWVGVARRDD